MLDATVDCAGPQALISEVFRTGPRNCGCGGLGPSRPLGRAIKVRSDPFAECGATAQPGRSPISRRSLAGATWASPCELWRQLRGMETQSKAMLREVLTPRVGELEANRDAALEAAREPVERLTAELFITHNDVLADFDEHTAFMLSQMFSDAVIKFGAFRARHIEMPSIETRKDEVATALAHLAGRLDDIHRPASMDQVGEDYAFSDDEWAAIKRRAIAARLQVPDALSEWQTASAALTKAYDDQLSAIKNRLVQLDRSLLR